MSEQITFEDMKKMVNEAGGNVLEETEGVEVEYVPIREELPNDKEQEAGGGHQEGYVGSGGDVQDGRDGGSTDVVRYSEESREPTGVELLDDRIAVIEKLRTYYSKIRQAAISVTQTEDWTNWGGKYRLNESGASKIMSQLGIHEETIETRKVNESWGYTVYISRRYVPSWNTSASFDALGSCRSDDPFVASRRVWDKDLNKKVMKTLPAEEVDESNVIKAAMANCRVNGVVAVCGLKTVSTDELDSAPYITPSKIEEVSFKGGKGKKKGAWEPSEKQVSWVQGKFGVTDEDIKKCKSYVEFQALVDTCKSGSYVASSTAKVEEDDF